MLDWDAGLHQKPHVRFQALHVSQQIRGAWPLFSLSLAQSQPRTRMGRACCTLESAAQEIGCPAPGWKVIATHPSSPVSTFLSLSPRTSSCSSAHSCHRKHAAGGAPERCPLLPSLEAESIGVIVHLTWVLSNISHLPWCYPEPTDCQL